MSDQTKSNQDAFSKKLMDILNYGSLNLAMGLGYRARLFDVMDTPRPVSTISKKAGLNERYVLEWLGIMVTGLCYRLRCHSRSDTAHEST